MTNSKLPEKLNWKDRVRHGVLPSLVKLTGSNSRSIWPLNDPEAKLIADAPKVNAAIKEGMEAFGKTETPLKIVFLTMIGGHRYLFATEAILSLLLQQRGHQVQHVICDQSLPACEIKKSTNHEQWAEACASCWSLGRHLATSFGLDVVGVSELLKDASPELDNSIDIDSIVEASLLKHFMVGSLDAIGDSKHERAEAYIEAAQRSLKIGATIVAQKPDRVIMSHGIYSTWGPARELLLENNIPVTTYGKGKKRQTIKFNWSTSADWWDVSEEWKTAKSQELTAVQESEIDSYLESRRSHSDDSMVYNFGKEEPVEAIKKRLGLVTGKTTFTLFTNVLWDAASAQREIAFKNAIDWVFETIRWFIEHPEKQLIVKVHPAEVVIGTKQPFSKIIDDEFPNLPPNIAIINPDAVINSWSVAEMTDLGLVHTSTVGMELPLEGTPVAVVSRTHFRDRGFTIDIENKNQYFELLDQFNPDSSNDTEMTKIAKRYAYLLFNRYQIPFDLFEEPNHADVRSFKLDKLRGLASSEIVNAFIPPFERGSGSFLLPRSSQNSNS